MGDVGVLEARGMHAPTTVLCSLLRQQRLCKPKGSMSLCGVYIDPRAIIWYSNPSKADVSEPLGN